MDDKAVKCKHRCLRNFRHICRISRYQDPAPLPKMSTLCQQKQLAMSILCVSKTTKWQLSTKKKSQGVLGRALLGGPGSPATIALWPTPQTLALCGLRRALWRLHWQALVSFMACTSPKGTSRLLQGQQYNNYNCQQGHGKRVVEP